MFGMAPAQHTCACVSFKRLVVLMPNACGLELLFFFVAVSRSVKTLVEKKKLNEEEKQRKTTTRPNLERVTDEKMYRAVVGLGVAIAFLHFENAYGQCM